MSKEITDAMLDERAEHLTSLFAMAGYGTFTQDPERIYRNVTRTALEVERESLHRLEALQWPNVISADDLAILLAMSVSPNDKSAKVVAELVASLRKAQDDAEAHIQVLRTRLGIANENAE